MVKCVNCGNTVPRDCYWCICVEGMCGSPLGLSMKVKIYFPKNPTTEQGVVVSFPEEDGRVLVDLKDLSRRRVYPGQLRRLGTMVDKITIDRSLEKVVRQAGPPAKKYLAQDPDPDDPETMVAMKASRHYDELTRGKGKTLVGKDGFKYVVYENPSLPAATSEGAD